MRVERSLSSWKTRGSTIASQDVTLPSDGEPATARVRFTLAETGPRVLHFRIPVLDGEQVTRNNEREALVTVVDRREKILYIEGQPRYEMKFLRQAVADDKNLQIVTLQRSADRKFLRLDIDAADDLAGGFPKTREELYAYRGIIVGSIEASAFTQDQLQMMADFVSLRGGGFLALGGRRSFTEGGYAGTPLAEALPVQLDAAKAADTFVQTLTVLPTRLGQTHVATQVGATEQASADRWATLPPVTTVNPIHRVKPGAAVLLTGRDGARDGQIVLAYQRYGAGKAIAFPVQDSWMWQMHADIPLEDQTHEAFWRRLLRWLVDGVPERLIVSVDHERVERGDTVAVTAVLRDDRFIGVNDASVNARVTGPDGRTTELPLTFAVDRDGEYRASFTTAQDGLYDIAVEASRGKDPPQRARTFVRAAPDDREYFDAAMRPTFLAPDRRRHGRPLLHAVDRLDAARGHHLPRPRCDRRAGEGSLGHARGPAAARGPRRRRVGASAPMGAGVTLRRLAAPLALALLGALGTARMADAQPGSHLLVIVGLGGDLENSTRFHQWASTIVDAARERYGLSAQSVVYLGEDPARDPKRLSGRSTRDAIAAAVDRLARTASPGDTRLRRPRSGTGLRPPAARASTCLGRT